MTFSILTHDRETGTFAAAAATGSLCVGGWVLRGDVESGLVASQGTAPSTFWRDDALRRMYNGETAQTVVGDLTGEDSGRGHRQMIALDRTGGTGGFTGGDSVAFAGHDCQPGLAIAGNMLSSEAVLRALKTGFEMTGGSPVERMFAALEAADVAGGDARGLQSAALLILSPEHPPLDLRIDFHETPIAALRQLCDHAHRQPYHDWLSEVPVLSDRFRRP
ncbi:MAG: DUF1028 domain-containing protein [Rhodobacteraceae bacterium]|nr:DUF1028 domain-containing protein [Paracoccaceae bacterium]